METKNISFILVSNNKPLLSHEPLPFIFDYLPSAYSIVHNCGTTWRFCLSNLVISTFVRTVKHIDISIYIHITNTFPLLIPIIVVHSFILITTSHGDSPFAPQYCFIFFCTSCNGATSSLFSSFIFRHSHFLCSFSPHLKHLTSSSVSSSLSSHAALLDFSTPRTYFEGLSSLSPSSHFCTFRLYAQTSHNACITFPLSLLTLFLIWQGHAFH